MYDRNDEIVGGTTERYSIAAAVPEDGRMSREDLILSFRRLHTELERALSQYGDHGLGEYAALWCKTVLDGVDKEGA